MSILNKTIDENVGLKNMDKKKLDKKGNLG